MAELKAISCVISDKQESIRLLRGESKVYCYDSNDILGSGLFSRVYRAWNQNNNKEIFAIKEVNTHAHGMNVKRVNEICEQEVKELQSIKENDSPHIVNLYECINTEYITYLVIEYCEGGDLRLFLSDKNDLTTDEIIYLFNQILEGFKVLRKHNRVHRDVKPENILVCSGVLKISDFQFTKNSVDAHTIGIGTVGYMAPEMMLDLKGIDQSKVDIFSLGVLLYWMVFRKTPWEHHIREAGKKITMFTVINEMKRQLAKTTPELWFPPDLYIDEGLRILIVDMMSFEAKNRISWEELFTHNRLKQVNFKPRLMLRKPKTITKIKEAPKISRVEILCDENTDLSEDKTQQYGKPFLQNEQDKIQIFQKTLSSLETHSQIYLFLYNVLLKLIRLKKEFKIERNIYYQLIYYLSRLVFIYSYNLEQAFEHNENVFNLENWKIFVEQKQSSINNSDYMKSQYKNDCIRNQKNHLNIITKIKGDSSSDAEEILDQTDTLLEISFLMLSKFMNNLKITLNHSKNLLNSIKNTKDQNLNNIDIVLLIEDLFILATLKTSFSSLMAESFSLTSFYERRNNTTIKSIIERVEGHFKDLKDFLDA